MRLSVHGMKQVLEKIIPVFIWQLFQAPTKKKSYRHSVPPTGKNMGCMEYMGDLLDHMGDYMGSIKKLRKYDPESYALYRNIGGQVTNGSALFSVGAIEKYWLEKRPAFGMIHLHTERGEIEIIPASLIYYQKIRLPHFVEKTSDEVYMLNVLFLTVKALRRKYPKIIEGGLCKCHIGVDKFGSVTLLRQVIEYSHLIRHRGRNKGFTTRFWRKKFDYPPFTEMWAYEVSTLGKKFVTPAEVVRNAFVLAANSIVTANAGLQVIAAKDGNNCIFNIDMLRTPYFFRDRNKVVNENGATKKIFHIVRTHERKTRKYGKLFIKTHFRGLRKFLWNGFNITVKHPKKSLEFIDFNVDATIYEADEKPSEKVLNMRQIGQSLKRMAER